MEGFFNMKNKPLIEDNNYMWARTNFNVYYILIIQKLKKIKFPKVNCIRICAKANENIIKIELAINISHIERLIIQV